MTSRLSSHAGHKRTLASLYNFQKRQNPADCNTQSLYKAPLADTVVDAMAGKLLVSWQTTCFNSNPQTIDLRLYAPHRTNITERRLQIWKNVPYAPGSIEVDLYPRWWDNAASVQLQFSIQESGNPFSSDYGPGPEFTATYTDTGVVNEKNDLNIIDRGYTYLKELIKSLSGGQIAGAVIGCLLFIALLVGGIFFLRRTRAKRAEQSKRFSQMVDKRMSTISQNWSSISPSAAQAAIRNSMAVYGRPSGDMSLHSSASVNNAGAVGGNTVGSGLRPPRSERSGTRVSFAPESTYGRPSSSIRNSTATSANRPYHYADAPPLPVRQASNENMTLSPTQAVGAFDLSPQEVDSRASQYNPDLMPALQLMRESETAQQPMLSSETPLPPVPAMTTNPKSPVGMMPMLDSGLSPDALLRGYATNKDNTMRRTNSLSVASSSAPSINTVSPMSTGPAYPSPVAGRTLYTPQTPTQIDNNPFRKSVAPTVASAYSGIDEEYEPEQQSRQQQQRPTRF